MRVYLEYDGLLLYIKLFKSGMQTQTFYNFNNLIESIEKMGGKSAEGVNNNINKSEDKDSDNSMTESTCVSES